MRVGLLHYWLTNMRGGERVFGEICKFFPDGDIFTHAWNRERVGEPFSGHRVEETFIGRLPLAKSHCQKYLPLMPLALKKLDLSDYDLLISSESGPVKGVCKRAGAKHICYCHSPMRYLWDMYEDYYRSSGLLGKAAMRIFRDSLRKYDLASADGVDLFLANSRFIAERIKRIYGRESVVVHPFADVEFFSQGDYEKKDYFLFFSELISYKRADLAIEACRRMNKKLIVAGDGTLRRQLEKSAAGSQTIFTGRIPRNELRKLYAEAQALIFPGVEDFGIVPVEAQSAATPVIARGLGGALETVVSGQTGVFFPEPTVDSLCQAMEEFQSLTFSRTALQKNAENFSLDVFRKNFHSVLSTVLPKEELPPVV